MGDGKRDSVGEAIGKIASGVAVLTAADDQKRTGVLVSWVQQVSFEPPMIMVAVKKGRPVESLIAAGKRFAVCVLSEDDNDLMRHFSRGYELDEDAFRGLKVATASTGAPVVTEAMAYMDCKLTATSTAGDHNLYIGQVVDGKVTDPARRPMVHIRKTGLSY